MTTAAFIGPKNDTLLNCYHDAFNAWSSDRFPGACRPIVIDDWQDQDSISSVLNNSNPDIFLSFVPVSSTDLCCKQFKHSKKMLLFAPPLETSAQAKKDLIKRCKKDRLSVGTLRPLRFSPGLAKVKEITESRVLGELTEIKLNLADSDSLLLSSRGNDDPSDRYAGFNPKTLMHLLDCAHWLLPSGPARNLTEASITKQTESEIHLNWQQKDSEPISLQITLKNPGGSAMSAEAIGECGHVVYEGPDSVNSGGQGKLIRHFSDSLNLRKNPGPIITPREQPLTNCFNLMQISKHDNTCFDCFFHPAADIVYESTGLRTGGIQKSTPYTQFRF